VGDPALSLKNLALLEPKRLLAKVADVELRSEDLRESLQTEFQGQMSHAGLSRGFGFESWPGSGWLVQDELLAQRPAGRIENEPERLRGERIWQTNTWL
jgi:hypothetical protein